MKLKELLKKYTIEEIVRKVITSEIYLRPNQLKKLLEKSRKGE